MEAALTLMEVAELTYDRVKDKGTFQEYCRFLLENKDNVWTICDSAGLGGMLIAKITDAFNLYVTAFVTLRPGFFEEFISRANEFFGEIKTVEYLRRGRLRKVSYFTLKQKANNE